MSEQFPRGPVPDNSPNFDDSHDIVARAITEGKIVSILLQDGGEAEAINYAKTAADRLCDFTGQNPQILIQTTYAWLKAGDALAAPPVRGDSFPIAGTINGFAVTNPDDDIVHLIMIISDITVPTLELPPNFPSSIQPLLAVPVTEIEAYSYLPEDPEADH